MITRRHACSDCRVKPRAAELLDHRAKEPVGDRQIEQHVGRTVLPLPLLDQQLFEPAEGFGLRKVSPHVMHAIG